MVAEQDIKQLWDEHYAGNDALYGAQPLAFLRSMLPRMKKGHVLDMAMGQGRNAAFLAQQGFQVLGVDISGKAIEKARALNADIECKQANVDLFPLTIMSFDSVVVSYFKPTAGNFTAIKRALKPDGTLLVEAWTHEERLNLELPESELCFGANELLRQLDGLRVLFYQELKLDGRHVVQALAKRTARAELKDYVEGTKGSSSASDLKKAIADKYFKS